MKTLATAAASLGALTLPVAAHTDGAMPLHVHPHGFELLLAIPLILAAGLGLYLMNRR